MPRYMQHWTAGVESNMRLTDPSQFYILLSGCGDRMEFDQLKRREFITLLGGASTRQSARTLCPDISAKALLRST
jgi:hypothetical protein